MKTLTAQYGILSHELMAIVVFRLVNYSLSYDAWGQQSVTVNTIGLRRGYTGHEMLPEFGIINMNGRLYDPVLGRFFSPDPFVQLPGSPQGFNRYSYCLNNPLKYTDPSGQLFGIDDAIIFAAFNMANSMLRAFATGGNIWKAGAMSILSSAAAYGVGQIFKATGNFGHELLRAGSHGAASGVLSVLDGGNFGSGFLSGAASSGISHLLPADKVDMLTQAVATSCIGGMTAWLTGGDFVRGALQGLSIAIFNKIIHDTLIIENGEYRYNFGKSVTCTNRQLELDPEVFEALYTTNGIVDCMAVSLKDYGGNSTLGSNGKLYFHPSGSQGFYGNQYISTIKLADLGSSVTKYTRHLGPVGATLDAGKMVEAGLKDYNHYQKTGEISLDNTIDAATDIAVSWAGAAAGASVGSRFGMLIGGTLGIGVVPMTIIGCAVGGILGGIYGPQIFDEITSFIGN